MKNDIKSYVLKTKIKSVQVNIESQGSFILSSTWVVPKFRDKMLKRGAFKEQEKDLMKWLVKTISSVDSNILNGGTK